MSRAWMIEGKVRERPRETSLSVFDNYRGEDVYHPNQPDHGQINEMLINLADSDRVILIGINPGDDDTIEEIAQEFKDAALWGLSPKGKILEDGYRCNPKHGCPRDPKPRKPCPSICGICVSLQKYSGVKKK